MAEGFLMNNIKIISIKHQKLKIWSTRTFMVVPMAQHHCIVVWKGAARTFCQASDFIVSQKKETHMGLN